MSSGAARERQRARQALLPESSWEAERDAGALFVGNDSGGKDSQRTQMHLLEHVPKEQILMAHATLGRIEWPGALEHAQQRAEAASLPFLVAQAYDKNGAPKDLLSIVRRRARELQGVSPFPQRATPYCTSELKKNPLEREIRRYADAHGFTRIVTVMGMRAAESNPRSKQMAWRPSSNDGVADRRWFEWLPIFGLSTEQVLSDVAASGQSLHHAYALGNGRLSCQFCFYGSKTDYRNAALSNPDLYQEYARIEAETGYTLHVSRASLPELTGIPVQPYAPVGGS